jgi:hypothetical protein
MKTSNAQWTAESASPRVQKYAVDINDALIGCEHILPILSDSLCALSKKVTLVDSPSETPPAVLFVIILLSKVLKMHLTSENILD